MPPSLADQLRRLRRHPSLAAFVLSSDELPPPAVEADFRRVAAEAQIDVPLIAAASWRHSTISGGTGVKMAGPYAWVLSFWGDARARTPEQGGAWGSATEICRHVASPRIGGGGGAGRACVAAQSRRATPPAV